MVLNKTSMKALQQIFDSKIFIIKHESGQFRTFVPNEKIEIEELRSSNLQDIKDTLLSHGFKVFDELKGDISSTYHIQQTTKTIKDNL